MTLSELSTIKYMCKDYHPLYKKCVIRNSKIDDKIGKLLEKKDRNLANAGHKLGVL